jgi:hypothetical protein
MQCRICIHLIADLLPNGGISGPRYPLLAAHKSALQKPASICADHRLCQRGCPRYLEVPKHRSQSNDHSHGESIATVSRHRYPTNHYAQRHGDDAGTWNAWVRNMHLFDCRPAPQWRHIRVTLSPPGSPQIGVAEAGIHMCRPPLLPKWLSPLLRGAKTPVSKQ